MQNMVLKNKVYFLLFFVSGNLVADENRVVTKMRHDFNTFATTVSNIVRDRDAVLAGVLAGGINAAAGHLAKNRHFVRAGLGFAIPGLMSAYLVNRQNQEIEQIFTSENIGTEVPSKNK
jgi:hypothetical protein